MLRAPGQAAESGGGLGRVSGAPGQGGLHGPGEEFVDPAFRQDL